MPTYRFERRSISTSTALARYRQRHSEPNLPQPPDGPAPWENVLVIPAFAEPPIILTKLASSLTGPQHCLIILVLNRPEGASDESSNEALRQAVQQLNPWEESSSIISRLNEFTGLYLYDMDSLSGPVSADEGVGCARKLGCDLALYWQGCSYIESSWICSSDADARLPADYFERLAQAPENSVAAVYPFAHGAGENPAVNSATGLYELRLHHYVMGLEYADSPYAFHALGSALAFKGESYAQVRGFPKRAGAEDFYLLNKLAKTGHITRLTGSCIELESRISNRVPFGTGPAVSKIIESGTVQAQCLFYQPQCFEALRCALQAIPGLSEAPVDQLLPILIDLALPAPLALASCNALEKLGLVDAISHCRRQGKSPTQFIRQFHQWFDGFRTLKFIHALRDSGWPQQSLADSLRCGPALWPGSVGEQCDVETLRAALRENWGWTSRS